MNKSCVSRWDLTSFNAWLNITWYCTWFSAIVSLCSSFSWNWCWPDMPLQWSSGTRECTSSTAYVYCICSACKNLYNPIKLCYLFRSQSRGDMLLCIYLITYRNSLTSLLLAKGWPSIIHVMIHMGCNTHIYMYIFIYFCIRQVDDLKIMTTWHSKPSLVRRIVSNMTQCGGS